MSRKNLLIASWIGGLTTAGGLIFIYFLGQVWVIIFGSGPGLIILVGILASVIAVLLGIGFAIGLLEGRAGNWLYGAFVLLLLAATLPPDNYGETARPWAGFAWAAALIGPSLFGFSLSRLRASVPMKNGDLT